MSEEVLIGREDGKFRVAEGSCSLCWRMEVKTEKQ